MRILPFFLIAVAVLEIMVFMWAGQYIGFWPTIGLVLASAIVGSFLVRAQGLQAIADLQRGATDPNAEVGKTLFTGACLLLAGAFLITPGFLTDITGLLLLVPSLRAAAYSALKTRLVSFASGGRAHFSFSSSFGNKSRNNHKHTDADGRKTTIIDVEANEKD